MTNDPLRCQICGVRIGVYEPLTVRADVTGTQHVDRRRSRFVRPDRGALPSRVLQLAVLPTARSTNGDGQRGIGTSGPARRFSELPRGLSIDGP